MCGFVGIIARDGTPPKVALLERMADTLRHRGPDDEGCFIDERVGLAHRRLSIIDLEAGHQPMTFDGITVAFNGEIYNFIELRADLAARGHRFRTASDTEVILRMYMEYGPAFVGQLNGMFAFLLYDGPRRVVLAARDHLGIKPLYFCTTPREVLFASEVKALLRHPEVRPAVDHEALKDYLTFQFVLGDRTLFQDIYKLAPGHYQLRDLTSGAVSTVRYWEPCFQVDPYHTEEYFIVELRRLLEDAIRLQMRSDVPVGTYLSGGLDSSIITLLASGHAAGPLSSFTGAFADGPAFDERPFAHEVARRCGARMTEVMPTAKDLADFLPLLVYHMDEPAAGPGLLPQYLVSRTAAEQVKVCLGGQGGDEIFGGYARYLVAYLEQALKGAILETAEEAEHIVSLTSIVPHLASLRAYTPLMRDFWSRDLFEPMDRRYFSLVDRSGGSLALYSDAFRESFSVEDVFSRFQTIFNHPDTLSYYNKMTHFDLVGGLPALLHVEDRMSMASSLESRVPLLDRRIVDLVTSMPPKMKFKGGEMKYILKRAISDIVPPSILGRKDKMGFPVPLHLWARGSTREFFTDILSSRSFRERGIFDPVEVDGLLSTEAAFGRRLWGILNLELWHRQFIDRSD
jgi:asparagine synthase (glutamine-hydrolysing)